MNSPYCNSDVVTLLSKFLKKRPDFFDELMALMLKNCTFKDLMKKGIYKNAPANNEQTRNYLQLTFHIFFKMMGMAENSDFVHTMN